MAGHSRSKNGVASLAYVPAISFCVTRSINSEIACNVASGASRYGECLAPGSSATSTGQ